MYSYDKSLQHVRQWVQIVKEMVISNNILSYFSMFHGHIYFWITCKSITSYQFYVFQVMCFSSFIKLLKTFMDYAKFKQHNKSFIKKCMAS